MVRASAAAIVRTKAKEKAEEKRNQLQEAIAAKDAKIKELEDAAQEGEEQEVPEECDVVDECMDEVEDAELEEEMADEEMVEAEAEVAEADANPEDPAPEE